MLRERIVELALATILIVALSTELLSAFHSINRLSISLVWLLIATLWIGALRQAKYTFTWD